MSCVLSGHIASPICGGKIKEPSHLFSSWFCHFPSNFVFLFWRRLSEFLILNGSAMFGATVNLVTNTLFDKCLDHILVKFEQKSYGPNYTKFWAFWHKMVNHFWQSVDAILEDISGTETIVWWITINLKTIIFQCSKTYSSLTRVTRLKVAPNMTDPISS